MRIEMRLILIMIRTIMMKFIKEAMIYSKSKLITTADDIDVTRKASVIITINSNIHTIIDLE